MQRTTGHDEKTQASRAAAEAGRADPARDLTLRPPGDRWADHEHLQAAADRSPRGDAPRQLQAAADGSGNAPALPPAPRPNRTGLPGGLKAGIEALSGVSLDQVRVHYNSSRPAALSAHAFAQGTEIHLAPGQVEHLPHEAWHVVQQAQGRVRPTMQTAEGTAVNDDAGLEREADRMGTRAVQRTAVESQRSESPADHRGSGTVQRVTFRANHEVIQRLTIAYTAEDILGGVAPDVFAQQTIFTILYQRDAIPNTVKLAVNAFGDCPVHPVPNTYKHHVAHLTILNGIRALYEGEDRETIVEWMTESLEAIGVNPATFGVDPMHGVASFNSWLDSAIVSLCDWPNNIFRGPSDGAALDTPTAPSHALTVRLAAARQVLQGLGFA